MSRRGPYKRYLTDVNVPIPETTLRRRNLQEAKLECVELNEVNLMPGKATEETTDSDTDIELMEWQVDECDSSSEKSFVSEESNSEPLFVDNNRQFFTKNEIEGNANMASVGEQNDTSDDENQCENFRCYSDNEIDLLEMVDADDVQEYVDDEDHGVDEEPPPQRVPLYEGCSVTMQESELLIMAYAMRFGLSDVALEHLIELIDCHLPVQQHGSLYRLLKNFPSPPTINLHFYCIEKKCQKLIKFTDNNEVDCECGLRSNMDDLKLKGAYFIQISLREQLKKLLNNPSINRLLRWEDNTQSDVINGKFYRKLLENGSISKPDISLQWNTDGVQIFKSSKVSLWPIQVCVNELPFKQRKENILLCGLWYGPNKPNMNTYMQPFVEELNLLHSEGLQCLNDQQLIQVKVHTLLASVDSQARPSLQNIKTYRGAHGCSFCLHPGEEVQVGRGAARLFRGDRDQLRTQRQHMDDTKKVLQTKQFFNGIKGPSVLLLLNGFKIIDSFVPEYMHCVLLGVVKTMVQWWLAGANKREQFYIGSEGKMTEMDSILLSIKPPSELTRIPRSIKDLNLWKASEWKNFLLYYSIVCLKGVKMPKKYVDHWSLLVYSMHVFLQERITAEEISMADKSLRKFVLSMESVYNTPQLMKFNVHLLLHITKSVIDFGALWSMSAFPYEHYNGILAKMFKSSQCVPQQICKSYLRLQSIKERSTCVFVNSNNDLATCAKSLYEKLSFIKNTSTYCTKHGVFLRLFGAPNSVTLGLAEKVAVEGLIQEEVVNNSIHCFKRFIFKNVLFHVDKYERMIKRTNNIVQLTNKDLISITHALKVQAVRSNRVLCVLVGLKLHVTEDTLFINRELGINSNKFAYITEETPEVVAVFPEMLFRKCVIIPYEKKHCVIPLANQVERD